MEAPKIFAPRLYMLQFTWVEIAPQAIPNNCVTRSKMSSAKRPEHFSVDDYLAMEEQALTKSEYVDGWIRAMCGAALRHNMVTGNCFVALSVLLKGKQCRAFNSDTKVRIDRADMKRFYYPDVQVVCQSNDQLSVFQDQPVLIIEVLSPSTRRYDLDEKMSAYLTIPSLECYVVLEQHQPIGIVMRRTKDGFLRETVEGIDAVIDLPFLGCSLPMRENYDGVEFTDECVQEPELEYEID
jgi:Uma2 family endonuclease